MKKKIAILGSTGSIGITVLDIIRKDKKNFEVILLTANTNYKLLLKQALKFKVRKVILTDKKSFEKYKHIFTQKKIKILNNFNNIKKIIPKKLDYTMSCIVGIDGLKPTINLIKISKKIAIANKESIICAWNLIKNMLEKYKTKFVPVDSEHFSIWYSIKDKKKSNIEKIYITASGGPLLDVNKNKFKNLRINQIIKHPNWSMGKKISVDSSTLMNKVLEVIEAKKIFNLNFNQVSILIHPKSYLHALVKFNDGMIKLIAHDTTMRVPIFNTIYENDDKIFNSNKINFQILNNLNLKKVNNKKFPTVSILKSLPSKDSLFETVLVSANDELVNLFLNKKITFPEISKILLKVIFLKEFTKYKSLKPKNVNEIVKLNKYVRLKINSMCI
tara:strand:+ start:122 stop:1285 length:1164 start_codon:yes stop_codon:yes gene_type:complete